MHILFVERNCVINLSAHKSAFASITVECAQIALAHAPHKGIKISCWSAGGCDREFALAAGFGHLSERRDGLIADNPFSELIRTKSADCCQFRMKNVFYGTPQTMLFFNATPNTSFYARLFCYSGILFFLFSIKLRKSLRDWWAHASDFVIVQRVANPKSESVSFGPGSA
jgi:hypothetical protein